MTRVITHERTSASFIHRRNSLIHSGNDARRTSATAAPPPSQSHARSGWWRQRDTPANATRRITRITAKRRASRSSECFFLGIASPARSVGLELLHPRGVERREILLPLVDEERAEDQVVHVRPREAAVRVLRRADDRLAAHVERRV